jgi:3-hydroxymyristoyl/3-hydroxydecanoyl-(acyl carrier protein) dehydratase
VTPTDFPHAYPFRLVDAILEERDADFSRGRVRVGVTCNGRLAMGERWGSPLLLAEAIAQSALLLEGGDPEIGRTGFLAGIDAFSVDRAPEPGERLSVDVALVARYGPVVKFFGTVRGGAERLASGEIVVRQGEDPA